ncbi:MAG TPA: hypothetical protein VL049_23745 [Candidatus Dormibacteraeota bacterium]|nr:hypothetical protein [Candidatus Dormibacteraeota bacterium]
MSKFWTILAATMLGAGLLGAAHAQCLDDCDANGAVAVNELITCVGVGLGQVPLAQCSACDGDGDAAVSINELISGVGIALGSLSCDAPGTPTIAGPTPSPTATFLPDQLTHCCVAAYYIWACEEHTVAECETLKGIDKGTEPCSPTLCNDIPPSNGHGICCLPNAAGTEIECEDRGATACTDAGGVVKTGGGVCTATTCADVAPPTIQCCVAKHSGTVVECDDVSPDACAALGGTNKGPGACSPDPCAP